MERVGRRDEGGGGALTSWMDAPFARTMAVAVAWNWFCTVYGRGTFAHSTFTLLSIFILGIPLALFGFLFDCCYSRKGPKSKLLLGVLWRVVFLIFIQGRASTLLIHLECGQYLLEKDVANAQAHCISFIDTLQAYRAEKGVYPPHLDLLAANSEVTGQRSEMPWILADAERQQKEHGEQEDRTSFYQVSDDGKSFRFYFEDPAAIGGAHYVYNSSVGEWRLVVLPPYDSHDDL